MKARYIGRTTLPMSLNMANLPQVITGRFYEIVKQNGNDYLIIDESGKYKIISKSLFERGDNM